MKIQLKYTVAIMLSALMISCSAIQNSNKTQRGAVAGAAGGALVGGLIGGDLKGALIGAAVGGASGAIIGNVMDKQAKKIEEAIPGAEVERIGEGIHLSFDDRSGVNFTINKSDLTPEAKTNLDALSEVFIEFPDTNLLVEGHTDSSGDEGYNMTLSKKRAQSVVDYLVAKGVSRGRFSVEGYGETKPRFDNSTEEGRIKNRRVEIGIVANQEMIDEAKAKAN
ncbi:OmpA family protein [Mangrovimonas sp. YM274]|uniref:OmpA family protein n=1 Tax=Mangrovimonas sp. YM274 TaxID=3070660 RepID=UPI0027DAE3E8|nr:OmpA family protein [Mangrovimonas sp. YM274]WMI67314.1 OmpA family protein [Mangrovimonas sp. YM274]